MRLSTKQLRVLLIVFAGLAILFVTVFVIGIERTPVPTVVGLVSGPPPEPQLATADRLDADFEEGAVVSIGGTVIEQDAERRSLVIDDAEGPIRVELPEALPLLTGQRLLVTGTLAREDGAVLVRASEWLYDSTAVVVHSE